MTTILAVTPIRLRIGAVVLLSLVGCPALAGFLEDFDGVPSGTDIVAGTLPGWDVRDAGFQTASSTFTSSPNSLRHPGTSDGIALMFHPAPGASDLFLSFVKQGTGNTGTLEVALTPTDQLAPGAGHLGNSGPRLEFFVDPIGAGVNRDVFFRSHGNFAGDNGNVVLDQFFPPQAFELNVWYDVMIHLEQDGTATYGWRQHGASPFTLSPGHALAPGFAPQFVAISHSNQRGDLVNIDDVGTVVPEPSTVGLLAVGGIAWTWFAARRLKKRRLSTTGQQNWTGADSAI